MTVIKLHAVSSDIRATAVLKDGELPEADAMISKALIEFVQKPRTPGELFEASNRVHVVFSPKRVNRRTVILMIDADVEVGVKFMPLYRAAVKEYWDALAAEVTANDYGKGPKPTIDEADYKASNGCTVKTISGSWTQP